MKRIPWLNKLSKLSLQCTKTNKHMKTFRVETKITVIKKIGYVIDAESEEEVKKIILSGEWNYEGEEEEEEYNWNSEVITNVEFIEDLED